MTGCSSALLLCVTLLSSDQRGAPATASASPAGAALVELNARFTVRGRPVHPGLIERFERWLSDSSEPVVVTVDALAAAGSNEYSDGNVTVDKKFVKIEKDREYFGYEWLGTIAPGLHVVQTSSSGGGSGVFEHLLVLRASAGTGQRDEGPYNQLLLSIVRTISLGDRDDGVVTITPNTITIGKSRYRDKPITLHFK